MNQETIVSKIDSVIRFFLYLLIFWLPYSGAVIECCVVISLILWLMKRAIIFVEAYDVKKEKSHLRGFLRAFKPAESFLNQTIALFIFACILAVGGSLFFVQSLHGFFTKTLEWFLVYFLIIETVKERQHVIIILAVLIFSATATCLDSLVQFHMTQRDIFSGMTTGGRGATGGFRHPNDLAAYLIFVVPILFSFLFLKQKTRNFLGFSFLFILSMWSLVVTLSRAGWLGAVVGILFCVFFLNKKAFQGALIAIGILAMSLLIILPESTKGQLRMDTGLIQETVNWRVSIWQDTLTMIKERPMFGHGLNTYMKVFQFYRRRPGENAIDPPTYAHNCYLQMAAEIGIVGLLSFLWLVGRLLRETIKKYTKSSPCLLRNLLIGFAGGIMAFLTQSFFDTNFYSLKLSVLFWFMVGISVAIYNLLNSKEIHDIRGDQL